MIIRKSGLSIETGHKEESACLGKPIITNRTLIFKSNKVTQINTILCYGLFGGVARLTKGLCSGDKGI